MEIPFPIPVLSKDYLHPFAKISHCFKKIINNNEHSVVAKCTFQNLNTKMKQVFAHCLIMKTLNGKQ